MCLLYELLLNIIKKFFSLNNICRSIMKTTMDMAIAYIESVDDENFLTAVMLERDFSGRDALRIAVELELLDLIQAPKIEAIIKRIYNSDYDQAGDLFEMSTPYKIVFGDKNANADIESSFRFYKKRELTGVPQSQWMFEIFKESMNARIMASGIMSVIFTGVSAVLFENVISTTANDLDKFLQIRSIKEQLMVSGDENEIISMLEQINALAAQLAADASALLSNWQLICFMCWLNFSFMIQHVVTFIFTKKLNRFYSFGILHVTDLALMVCSILFIQWYNNFLTANLNTDPNLSQTEKDMRLMGNITANIDY